jgi:hypothetical protein
MTKQDLQLVLSSTCKKQVDKHYKIFKVIYFGIHLQWGLVTL